jgi:hypothetical protein
MDTQKQLNVPLELGCGGGADGYCLDCTPGGFVNVSGSANIGACASCPAGKFSAQTNSFACEPCVAGQFQPTARSIGCVSARTWLSHQVVWGSPFCCIVGLGRYGDLTIQMDMAVLRLELPILSALV